MHAYEAEELKWFPPRLAPDHTLPDKPVYWLIWILNPETGKPDTSRCTHGKVLTPVEAAQYAYGVMPTRSMLFFNLSSTLVGARRRMREAALLSETYIDQWIIR